jgi:hypothetical protein
MGYIIVILIRYLMSSVRLLFFTACAVYAYYLLSHANWLSVRLQFVTACAVYAYNLQPHAQCTLTIGTRMCSTLYAYSTKYLAFFIINGAYANNLLPYAQYMLIICYRMRSVRLLFAIVCAVYSNKANNTFILSFQLNQVKTYEKSKKSKKVF